MEKSNRGWRAIRSEGFLRLVFYRGCLQFGLLAAGAFILLAALRGDNQLADHTVKALIVFPLLGLVFGAVLWAISKLLGNKNA